MRSEKLYINGQFLDSKSNEWIEVENPATEEIFAKVIKANEDDINLAVEAAKNAFKTWKRTSIQERISYIENLKNWMLENEDRFIETMRDEFGVAFKFAKAAHFDRQIARIENFIEQIKEFDKNIEMKNGFVRYEPVGVVACITPWNYPLGQIIQKVIPALLSGSTVVLKPAGITPLTACLLIEGFDSIGIPKGVINLITGKGSEVGDILNTHKDVNKVSFTGSTKAGIKVAGDAIESVKKITLELGGKSPAVFLEGADIGKSVKTVLDTIFYNTGQTCSALSRIVVLETIRDEVIKEIKKQVDNYTVGDPKDKNVKVGPLSSKEQFEKVKKYIELGVKEGAELIIGEIPEKTSKGYFVKPVVFDKVTKDMTIHKDEIFGPVLCIETAKNIDEAIEIANSVDYGLSAAVFGNDEEALNIAYEIEAGQVIVNSSVGDTNLPFGGYKKSGLGREGGYFGIKEFYEVKSIHYSK